MFSVVWSPVFSRSSGKLGDVYLNRKKKEHVNTNIALYSKNFLIYFDRNAASKEGSDIKATQPEMRLPLLIGCQAERPQISTDTVANTTSLC